MFWSTGEHSSEPAGSKVNPYPENVICANRNNRKESEAENEERALRENAHSLVMHL